MCAHFFALSHFHFTHNDVKWAEFVVTACNRTLLHGLHVCMCIELSLNLNLKSNCQYKIRCQSHFYLFFGDEIWWASKAWKTFFSHTLFSLSILIHIDVFFCVCYALSHKSERLLMNDGTIYATNTSTMWNNQSWIFTCHWHKMKCYLHNVQLRLWQIEWKKKSNGISRSTEQIVIPHQNTRRIRKNLFSIHFAH